jgi:4-amino-4-deoxy-L-arabinose transferase-like glycosyltransferase
MRSLLSHLSPTAFLFLCIAIASVALVIDIDADTLSSVSDEGVYWQSLRAMNAGNHLYKQIFYSQPPLFLTSIYPFYELLGSTIKSARLGVAVLSLLGLVGAYLIGKALAGRAASIAAVVLLMVTPMYLEQSHILRAEGPATGLLLLTVGAALMWWESPSGRKGLAFAVLSAVTLVCGILIKLLDVTAVVPIALLVLGRLWQIRDDKISNIWASIGPIVAATIVAGIASLIILSPFLQSLDALVQQVISFHLAARKIEPISENFDTLRNFFIANRVLAAVGIVGVAVTIIRRDWRLVPMLGWFLATLILLAIQVPLRQRHVPILIPPLIAFIALGLKDLPAFPLSRPIRLEQKAALLMASLAFAVVISGIRKDYHHYRWLIGEPTASSADHWMQDVAADLQRVTTPDQWIISDAQYAVALANRDTPPWLADVSQTRRASGYLTSDELQQAAADVRVHAVVFGTSDLASGSTASFHAWVTEHFKLLRAYGNGIETWVR